MAIAALDEATIAMRVRTSPEKRGLPEMDEKGPLASLVGEVNNFRLHMSTLLKSWERDNLLVYFDKVREREREREWVGCCCTTQLLSCRTFRNMSHNFMPNLYIHPCHAGATLRPIRKGITTNPTQESRAIHFRNERSIAIGCSRRIAVEGRGECFQ